MSEYQYYEFMAIDRPLSNSEIDELRAYSTRAKITSTSFVNVYNWGDFKGNPNKWMDKYFDAHLYISNWGSRHFDIRLPANRFDQEATSEYWDDDYLAYRTYNDKVIISFIGEELDDEPSLEAERFLSSMIAIREDIANHDYRALYLGWLSTMQGYELADEEDDGVEPPVPPGLGELSIPLKHLVEFLDIDEDLIAAAAERSPALKSSLLDEALVYSWVEKLDVEQKNNVISSFLVLREISDLEELRHKFIDENDDHSNREATITRRSVSQLIHAGKKKEEERTLREAEHKAKKDAIRKLAEANERIRYLDKLALNEGEAWSRVENLIDSKLQKKYDEAVQLLVDLKDLSARLGRDDFSIAIDRIRFANVGKKSFLKRLDAAGL